MAARSKAWIYSCSLAGNECSNPVGGIDACLVSVGRGLCDRPVPRPDKSYRVKVITCDQVQQRNLYSCKE